jgi:hypothetical protein
MQCLKAHGTLPKGAKRLASDALGYFAPYEKTASVGGRSGRQLGRQIPWKPLASKPARPRKPAIMAPQGHPKVSAGIPLDLSDVALDLTQVALDILHRVFEFGYTCCHTSIIWGLS